MISECKFLFYIRCVLDDNRSVEYDSSNTQRVSYRRCNGLISATELDMNDWD